MSEKLMSVNLFINSRTTGKFSLEEENGRTHMITQLVPIVGDTVMHNIFHPDDKITNDMLQFDMLPAPAGHPEVKGITTSINHPMANNVYGIGGFIRSPRKSGKKVVCDLWLDKEVAEKSEKGKQLIAKIENGEKVGVSTGGRGQTHPGVGVAPDGKPYTRIYDFAEWDHVAILLDEKAAGDHVGTQLLNEAGEEVVFCNVELPGSEEIKEPRSFNELFEAFQEAAKAAFSKAAEWIFVEDILLSESAAIISAKPRDGEDSVLFKVPFSINDEQEIIFGDDIKKVIRHRKETFEVVTNSENPFEPGEGTMAEITEATARAFLEKEGLKVLSAKDVDAITTFKNSEAAFTDFVSKKPAFDAWQKSEADRVDKKRLEVLENSAGKLTKDDLENVSEKVLDAYLESSGKTEMNNSLRPGGNLDRQASGDVTEADLDAALDDKGGK